MKKNILSLAALLIASATMFTACSSDDSIISENQQPAQTTGKYTMTVQASKGDGAGTRALTLDGNTLNAMWATTENVYVKKGSSWATGSLKPQADGATATLKGTLSGVTIAAGDELTLQFPKSGTPDYTKQVGTLADIAANFDYATASVTVSSVDGSGNITVSDPVTFTNQQSIVKFTLKNGETLLNAGTVTVQATYGGYGTIFSTEFDIPDGTYTTNGDGIIYLAIPSSYLSTLASIYPSMSLAYIKSSCRLNITATVGDDTYSYTKNGWPFEDGKYYEITVKMTKHTQLSTITSDYTAQDGEILTGTLGSNVKISIADGATVTLKDVNITNLGNNCDWAGINCPEDATLVLEGTNEVCPGKDKDGESFYPGIWIAENKTLTIQGDGTLTAYSNASKQWGAGIGGGYSRIPCGNIVINGGTITATGGEWAAGIGGGGMASCGNITINGGTITATGGEWAAGIGGGFIGSCGTITITSGVTSVTATKGSDADNSIGAGNSGSCGTVTIEDPSKVTQN